MCPRIQKSNVPLIGHLSDPMTGSSAGRTCLGFFQCRSPFARGGLRSCNSHRLVSVAVDCEENIVAFLVQVTDTLLQGFTLCTLRCSGKPTCLICSCSGLFLLPLPLLLKSRLISYPLRKYQGRAIWNFLRFRGKGAPSFCAAPQTSAPLLALAL